MRTREGLVLQELDLIEVEKELREMDELDSHSNLNGLVPIETENTLDYELQMQLQLDNDNGGPYPYDLPLSINNYDGSDERILQYEEVDSVSDQMMFVNNGDPNASANRKDDDSQNAVVAVEQNVYTVKVDDRHLRCRYRYLHNPFQESKKCDYCKNIPYVSSPLVNEVYRRYVVTSPIEEDQDALDVSPIFLLGKRRLNNFDERHFEDDDQFCPSTDDKSGGLSSYFQKLATITGRNVSKDKKAESEHSPRIRKVKGYDRLNKNT